MNDITTNAERCPACAATAPYWRPDAREYEVRFLSGERTYVDFVSRVFSGIRAAVAAL